jgi:CheY-like chemotaxis protein
MAIVMATDRASQEPVSNRGDPYVLVVDDDLDIRSIIEDVLVGEGYSVVTAANGATALDILKARPPRLILLDLTMPVMGGAEFRRIQLEDLDLASVPTVVMTARRDPGLHVSGLSVRACLPKPIQLDELLRIVAHYCA